jgi:hypothetical protein
MSTATNPLSTLESAAIQVLAAPFNTALTSIQANPTTLNVAAQVAVIQGALIGAAPALETVGIKDIAALLQAKLTAWETSLTTPATPAAPTA